MRKVIDPKYKKVVYFIRHGESEGNVLPFYQPLESPLTDEGRKQAKQIAERIAKLSFDTLISSPLNRAKETAQAITTETGKIAEYSDLFVERKKPSSLGGQPHGDKRADDLNQLWEKSLYTPHIRADDGENYDDLILRADRALKFLAERKEERIVVVTHGYFLRTLIIKVLLAQTITPEAFKSFQARITTENAGLSAIRYAKIDDGMAWRLWVFNDHEHLA